MPRTPDRTQSTADRTNPVPTMLRTGTCMRQLSLPAQFVTVNYEEGLTVLTVDPATEHDALVHQSRRTQLHPLSTQHDLLTAPAAPVSLGCQGLRCRAVVPPGTCARTVTAMLTDRPCWGSRWHSGRNHRSAMTACLS